MTTETITDPVTERVAVAIAREHRIGAADWNHLLPTVRVLYRECARAALAAAGVEQLRAQVERLTAENADLQQALSKAERHDADIRLEAESDVRAELAEKAGA